MPSANRLTDGSFDFSGGVDSLRPTMVQSPVNPHGLPRTMLAWGSNVTMRGGGIKQRFGWNQLAVVSPANALYQSGFLYQPLSGNPYLILSIGGVMYSVRVDSDNSVHQLTSGALLNPATVAQGYMEQAEQFLIVQAGDWSPNQKGTLPLFFDGNTWRRSDGITNTTYGPFINEIPSALAMVYYQDRLWYANGRVYAAGDIVGGPSGTNAYNFTDSVLKVTENPLAVGGDGFTVPSSAGVITALNFTAQLDTSLGQGNLYIFTRKQVYYLVVPVTRMDWISASNNNQPQQGVALTKFGAVSDRSVVKVNGDLFYFSSEPAVRTLFVSTRYFEQWGNVPISRNVQRALGFTTPTLLATNPGINFDNRLLMGCIPISTPAGVAFQGLLPLDFDLISTLQDKLPPAWEGILEGLNILQLFEGDFGGQNRAFAVVYSQARNQIEAWELTTAQKNDWNDTRVTWRFESPSYTFGKDFDLKKLDGGEIWVDAISGTVQFTVEYRTDADACWRPWLNTQFCSARNSCETLQEPVCYPTAPVAAGFKFPLTLPAPLPADPISLNYRPSNVGYGFQVRVTVKGFMRVRAILLFAIPVDRRPYEGLASSETPSQPDGTIGQ